MAAGKHGVCMHVDATA